MIVDILMGIAYVLPPGPVTVETVRQSLRGGVRAALAVQLGAVAGDLIYAALIMTGIGGFLLHGGIRLGLGLIGAVLLVYLGVSAFSDGRVIGARITASGAADHASSGRSLPLLRRLGAGLMLALANPYAVVFWLSMGTALDHSTTSLAGFFLGSLLASVLTALLAGQLHRRRASSSARRGGTWPSLAWP